VLFLHHDCHLDFGCEVGTVKHRDCESASNLDPTPIVHQIVEAEAELFIPACSIDVQP